MIIYNSNSTTSSGLTHRLSKILNIEVLEVSKINLNEPTLTELIILFINVSGEEELSTEWEILLKSQFINKKRVVVFLFGIYDDYIDQNSIIVKQIYHYLEMHNQYIEIFPKKISKFNLDVNEVKEFVLYLKSKNIAEDLFHKEILSLTHINQKLPKIYDAETLNLTCNFDGFSNLLNVKNINSYQVLHQILLLSSQKIIICNRVDLSGFNYELIENNILEKIYFKSCLIQNTPKLSNFSNLKIINFSANKITELEIDNFPSSVKRINFSKNTINKILLNKRKNYHHIESLALFNNRLIDFEWLNFFKKIKYLNIGMNPIIHVPEEIFELKDLEHLNIAVTNIKYLPKEILDLNNLKKLDIKHFVNLSSNDFVLKKLISRGVEVIC